MSSAFFSNFSSAHFAAHKKYIGGTSVFDCSYIMSINQPSERCEYSKNPGCHETEGFIDYITFLFCHITQTENTMLISHIVLISLSLLFIAGLVMNAFASYAPNMIAVIFLLRVGEYSGGAIFVAIFNGISEIIGRIVKFEADTELVLSEMFGTAVLVMTFQAGLIAVMFPFVIRREFFLRDQAITILTFIFLVASLKFQPIHVAQGIVLMALYVIFVTVAITHFHIKLRIDSARGETDEKTRGGQKIKKLTYFTIQINEEREFGEGTSANDQLFRQFFRTLNPIKSYEMEGAPAIKKFFLVLAAPLRILFTLVLPCVNYRIPGNGWSKLMNCINLVLTPLTLFGVTRMHSWHYYLLLIPGAALAPLVFFTSRTDQPPWYHSFFAFYGTFGSICINYFFTMELRSVLSLLSIINGVSIPDMSMTIFPWGNTFSDLVLNMTLASLGFRTMAFVAYIYCPMLDVYFGIGMILALKYYHFKETYSELREGDHGATAEWFLMVTLLATTISVWLTRFQIRKSTGVFLIVIYIVYAIFMSLAVLDIIHDYGTDHVIEIDSNTKDAEWS